MTNKNLSYEINKARSMSELDAIERDYPSAFDHPGGLRLCLEMARKTLRHIETLRNTCKFYNQN